MRAGLLVAVTLLVLGGVCCQVHAQSMPENSSSTIDAQQQTLESPASADRADDPVEKERLPDVFRSKLLVWIAGCSLMIGFAAYLARSLDWQRAAAAEVCPHCRRVHAIGGTLALVCDAAAASAFFYALTLPLLSAVKGRSFEPSAVAISLLLCLSMVIALTAVGALLNLLGPQKRARAMGDKFLTGMRAAGFLAASILLAGGISTQSVTDTFSSEIGQRLLATIGVTPFRDAAVVLLLSSSLSCLLRWGFPFLAGSRPLALARSGEFLHRSNQIATL
jgi:hypothetical protein